MMADKRCGALLVMTDLQLVGIISERDYTRDVILKGRQSRETKVEEIMSAKVVTAPSHESVQASLALMADNHIRLLPVVDDSRVVGVLSIGCLLYTSPSPRDRG